MATVVDVRTSTIHRMVCELRYDFGHIYWDRCGRIVNEMLSASESWDFQGVQPGHCHIRDDEKNIDFTFGFAKLDLSQTVAANPASFLDPREFGALAEDLSERVIRLLELSSFSRIGFRTWYLFPTADREESYTALHRLRLFKLDPDLVESLGPPSESSFRMMVERPDMMVRVAVSPFEQNVKLPEGIERAARQKARLQPKDQRQAQLDQLRAKKIVESLPHYGVLVDLDASMDTPPIGKGVSVADFVVKSVAAFTAMKPIILTER